MFLKQTMFERLIKEAYKGSGLYVACTNSDTNKLIYVIAGSWWVLWIGTEWITKEAKASIIKLCGDLPEPGMAYRARKDCPEQLAMDDQYNPCLNDYGKCGPVLRKTKLMAICTGLHVRVLQQPNGKIYLMQQSICDLIDKKAVVHEEGEQEPVGPNIGENGKCVYWRNNVATLMAMLCDIPEDEQDFWKAVGMLEVI